MGEAKTTGTNARNGVEAPRDSRKMTMLSKKWERMSLGVHSAMPEEIILATSEVVDDVARASVAVEREAAAGSCNNVTLGSELAGESERE